MASGLRDDDLALIRSTALFSGLSADALGRLVADSAAQAHERGTLLFMQGDEATAFYIVLEGWVKIYRMTPTGEEAVLAVFTRGQSFAEAAAFTGGVYPASAETVTDCRILAVPTRRLAERMRESPEIGLAMLASTARHLHGLVQQIEQLKAHTGAQRVAEFLISLAPVESGPCTIALPYDKALIAGRLGMKPESLSRAFQRLRPCGLNIRQNMASIGDVAKLKEFVLQERAEILRAAGVGRGRALQGGAESD
jgi:CRP/FNR family transcriptional regulator, dissimilatory nitrate respiration regulator